MPVGSCLSFLSTSTLLLYLAHIIKGVFECGMCVFLYKYICFERRHFLHLCAIISYYKDMIFLLIMFRFRQCCPYLLLIFTSMAVYVFFVAVQ